MAYPLRNGAQQLAAAIAMDAAGVPRNAIAAELGLPPSSITRKLNTEATKELIAACQARLLDAALTPAIENQIQKIKIGQSLVAEKLQADYDPGNREAITDRGQWLNLAERAENKLLESVGIHASHSTSVQIANILNVSQSEMPAEVRQLLDAVRNRDAVDAEWEE